VQEHGVRPGQGGGVRGLEIVVPRAGCRGDDGPHRNPVLTNILDDIFDHRRAGHDVQRQTAAGRRQDQKQRQNERDTYPPLPEDHDRAPGTDDRDGTLAQAR